MLDCGADVAAPREQALPDSKLLRERQPVCVLITHAHVDHVGGLPAILPSLPTSCDVVATSATRDAAAWTIRDAAAAGDLPGASSASTAAALARIAPVEMGERRVLAGGRVRVTALPAGHVIGACGWLVEFAVAPRMCEPPRSWKDALAMAAGPTPAEEDGVAAPAAASAQSHPPPPRDSKPGRVAAGSSSSSSSETQGSAPSTDPASVPPQSSVLAPLPPATQAWPGTSASLLYTGDVGTMGECALPSPLPLRLPLRPDVLVTESTYLPVHREARGLAVARLLRSVSETVAAGGDVLVPAFALGRAQEVASLLGSHFANDARLRCRASLWLGSTQLHSPGAAEVRTSARECGPRPTLAALRAGGASLLRPPSDELPAGLTAQFARVYAGHAAAFAPGYGEAMAALAGAAAMDPVARPDRRPCKVTVTAPLGLTRGMALAELQRCAAAPLSRVIFTGRCPAGTHGRALQDGALAVDLPAGRPGQLRQRLRVRCRVETVSLSAHADGDELVAMCDRLGPRAGVVLVHGTEAPSPDRTGPSDMDVLASARLVLQTRLRVPVYDPPDMVAVNVALPIRGVLPPGPVSGDTVALGSEAVAEDPFESVATTLKALAALS